MIRRLLPCVDNAMWRSLFALFLISWMSFSLMAQSNILDNRITVPRQQTTLYQLFNQISVQTGYFFIYDSDLIDNNKRIRTQRSQVVLRDLLSDVIGDPSLEFTVLEQHILISRRGEDFVRPQQSITTTEPSPWLIIQGRILDEETRDPLPFATIIVEDYGIGTTSNMQGDFLLKIPSSLRQNKLKVSYMGYQSQRYPLYLIDGKHIEIIMEADYISMQEVIIRYYDPQTIVREALSKIRDNYSNTPTYLTSFYREGVMRDNRPLNYSEAIFKIYKPSYQSLTDSDQAKLLKSRVITNQEETDTLILKIKAGVRSALELDIINTIPSFIDIEFLDEVTFSHVDMLTKDGGMVYAVGFEQNDPTFLPVFAGTLYIDTEDLTIISAEFEVHPRFLDQSKHIFLNLHSNKFNAHFDRIHYTVSYQKHNGRHHLAHVRGDLHIRIRPRNRIFSTKYHAFLELVVVDIDEQEAERFRRRETFNTQTIFMDEPFQYDFDFWGAYNIIPPEKQTREALYEIRSKVESIINEEPMH